MICRLSLFVLIVATAATVLASHGHQHLSLQRDSVQPGSVYSFYCHGKSVGNYHDPSNPCSRKYFSCVADGYPSRGIRRSCPDDLYFSEEHDKCLQRDFVAECEHMEEEDETAFEKFFRLHNRFVSVCKKGQYEHPDKLCSAEYIVCDDGSNLKKRICPFPEHLRYDKVTQRCLEAEFVAACNPDLVDHLDTEPDHKIEEIECPLEGTVFVAHTSDRCTGEYYACVDGQAFTMHCPRNLLFDDHSMQCQSAQNLPYCHEHVAHLNVQVEYPSHHPHQHVVSHTHKHGHVVVPTAAGHGHQHNPYGEHVAIGAYSLRDLGKW